MQRRPFSHGAEFLLIGRNWDFNCRGADFTFVPAICESCYKNIRLRGWAPGAELETHLITSDPQGLTAVFGSVDRRGRSLPASPPGLWKRGCKGGAAAPFRWGCCCSPRIPRPGPVPRAGYRSCHSHHAQCRVCPVSTFPAFPVAVAENPHTLGGRNNRLTPHGPGGQRSKSRCWRGPAPLRLWEGPSRRCQPPRWSVSLAALAVATSLPPSLRASRLHGSSSVCRQTELSPTLNSDRGRGGGQRHLAEREAGAQEPGLPAGQRAADLHAAGHKQDAWVRGSGSRGPLGAAWSEGRGGEGSESFLQLSRTALRSSGVPLSGPWESTGGSFHLGTQELTHAWVRMSPVAHQRSGLRDHR